MDVVVILRRSIATAPRRSPCIREGVDNGSDVSRERIDIQCRTPAGGDNSDTVIGKAPECEAEYKGSERGLM